MKKTNKGFSMVELIIVIAIMAILAGALAPALIKYINKSRLSTDIQTGQTIATAIQTALSNESAYSDAKDCTNSTVANLAGTSFKSEVMKALGNGGAPAGKSTKDATGSEFHSKDFYVTLKASDSQVEVYYGVAGDKSHMVYPNVGDDMESK